MEGRCEGCAKTINVGDKVIQVVRGRWYERSITPTIEHVDSEWHRNCFEGSLGQHSSPYSCATCGQVIEHGDLVNYVTDGFAVDASYLRSERRGKTLSFIAHVKCPNVKSDNEEDSEWLLQNLKRLLES